MAIEERTTSHLMIAMEIVAAQSCDRICRCGKVEGGPYGDLVKCMAPSVPGCFPGLIKQRNPGLVFTRLEVCVHGCVAWFFSSTCPHSHCIQDFTAEYTMWLGGAPYFAGDAPGAADVTLGALIALWNRIDAPHESDVNRRFLGDSGPLRHWWSRMHDQLPDIWATPPLGC